MRLPGRVPDAKIYCHMQTADAAVARSLLSRTTTVSTAGEGLSVWEVACVLPGFYRKKKVTSRLVFPCTAGVGRSATGISFSKVCSRLLPKPLRVRLPSRRVLAPEMRTRYRSWLPKPRPSLCSPLFHQCFLRRITPECTSLSTSSAKLPPRKTWIADRMLALKLRAACNELDGPILEAGTNLQAHGTCGVS